jgi:hypothetical protein
VPEQATSVTPGVNAAMSNVATTAAAMEPAAPVGFAL